MAELLSMEHISIAFAGNPVLRDVTFSLRSGEIHLLAGENGAGKTTLMRILGGVYTEYQGTIRLNGHPVRFHSPVDAARHGVAMIHQELSVIPSMTILDNLFLGREQCGRGGWIRFRQQRAACREILSRVGLDLSPDTYVEDLPMASRQMLEIAKALSVDARVIVMDEPTSSLTAPEVERLFGLIGELKAQGRGIVYITHKMEEIYRVSDRITVLRDGAWIDTRLAADLPREELVKLMVGREMKEQFPERPAVAVEDTPLLEVNHFTIPDPSGRPRPLVDDVSFTVRPGEILGVGGLQGSGATELFLGLFGALGGKTTGNILLDSKPYQPRSPAYAISRGIACLTNDRKETGLALCLDIVANSTLAALPRFSPAGIRLPAKERQAAAAAARRLSLRAASLDMPVENLSGGNQQKVVLAKWMLTKPRLILMDEPTRGVDVGAKHEIYSLLFDWSRERVGILLITSEMPELLALSDRIMVLHRGRVTGWFTCETATPEAVLAAAMGRASEEVTA